MQKIFGHFGWLLVVASLLVPCVSQAQQSVRVQPLAEVLVNLERRAPADVRSLNDSVIAAEVAAVVRVVNADVGQQVKAGGLLLELESVDYELNLAQAQANLKSAKARKAQADAKLSRALELSQDQYLSADELLERKTDVMVSNASIETSEVAVAVAQRNLDKCSIYAPFDAVVVSRSAQVGSYVSGGTPLFRVLQLDAFELDADIPASQADSLSAATGIRFASQGKEWPLRLLRLSPAVNTEQRSRRARFAFTSMAPVIGTSGEVIWEVEGGVLPSNLVSRREGRLGVFVHSKGIASFIPLPNAQEGRPVSSNLPTETEVITLGRDRLQPGDAITVAR